LLIIKIIQVQQDGPHWKGHLLLLKNKAGAESLPPGITAAYRLILSNTKDLPVPFGANSAVLTQSKLALYSW
jgi:hypothetical protein